MSRVLIPSDPPTTLLETSSGKLEVGPGGLLLVLPTDPAARIPIDGWELIAGEHGWILSGDEALPMPSAEVERMFTFLGRHANSCAVSRRQLDTLVAPCLVFLRDAAKIAGATGTPMYIHSGRV
jgi:hypothetical protein